MGQAVRGAMLAAMTVGVALAQGAPAMMRLTLNEGDRFVYVTRGASLMAPLNSRPEWLPEREVVIEVGERTDEGYRLLETRDGESVEPREVDAQGREVGDRRGWLGHVGVPLPDRMVRPGDEWSYEPGPIRGQGSRGPLRFEIRERWTCRVLSREGFGVDVECLFSAVTEAVPNVHDGQVSAVVRATLDIFTWWPQRQSTTTLMRAGEDDEPVIVSTFEHVFVERKRG